MKIREFIKPLGDYKAPCNFEVAGLSCNSKHVFDNFVFVAIKGVKEDGNKYVDEAIDRGAGLIVHSALHQSIGGQAKCKVHSKSKIPFIAVKDTRKALAELAARFYGKPSLRIKVAGVTGTNGKTTITYLIEALLKQAGDLSGVIGTINYRIKGRIAKSKNTTPGPIELESMLSDMAGKQLKYCVMEVSSHALDQDRVAGIKFHSAIFTNLTQDHLDYHGTLENYFKCKAKLFRDMGPSSTAVINNDDKFGVRLKRLTRARVITYGIDSCAQVMAKDIEFSVSHTKFRLVCFGGEIGIVTSLIGKHNVYNILAAAAWAKAEGIGLSLIKEAIERLTFVPGRLERIDSKKRFSVFVDYAHTEDALKNVISSLRKCSAARIIVVFGCGGERDKTKRPKMGRVVTQLSDYAIITNDNPRSEDPLEIIEDIKSGIKKANFCIIPERSFAIKKAILSAKPGDIVLVAGKGHEDYQILKDKVLHFDDREAVRKCLKSMNY